MLAFHFFLALCLYLPWTVVAKRVSGGATTRMTQSQPPNASKENNTKRWKRELYILNSTVSSEIHCTVHCTTFHCTFRKLLYKSCAKDSLLSLKIARCTEPSKFPKVQFPITPGQRASRHRWSLRTQTWPSGFTLQLLPCLLAQTIFPLDDLTNFHRSWSAWTLVH